MIYIAYWALIFLIFSNALLKNDRITNSMGSITVRFGRCGRSKYNTMCYRFKPITRSNSPAAQQQARQREQVLQQKMEDIQHETQHQLAEITTFERAAVDH